MKRLLRLFRRVLAAFAVLAALAVLGVWARARWFLPETELTVLLYERVCEEPSGPDEVSPDDFQEQLRDLYDCGYRTVTPEALRRHLVWGSELPARPVLILFAAPSANLVLESEDSADGAPFSPFAAGSVEATLRDFEFTAVVALPSDGSIAEEPGARRTGEGGVPLLSWAEVGAAERRGTLSFAAAAPAGADAGAVRAVLDRLAAPRLLVSRDPAGSPGLRSLGEAVGARFAFGAGGAPALVGARTDPFAIPSVPVVGGTHRFSVRLVQNAVTPDAFGELLVAHAAGPEIPFLVSVYNASGDHPTPLLTRTIPAAAHSQTSSIALPAGLRFPVSVYFYDETGSVFYHRREIPRSAVEKAPHYRAPVGLPDEEVPFEPL